MYTNIYPTAARVILAAAAEAGLTQQKQLAEAAGMSPVTVQKLLSGDQSIKLHQFFDLIAPTHLSPAEVMARITAALEHEQRMSQARDNNVVRLHPRDMSVEQLENLPHVANRDKEAQTDEFD